MLPEPSAADFPALAATLLDARDPRLRALARRRPWRVVADAARCYALILAAFVLAAQVETVWALALAFVVIGTQQYALAVIEHDGKHGTLLANRAANDRFTTWLLCAPLGLDPDFSRKVADHLGHHRLLGTPPDPERLLYTAADKGSAPVWLLYLSGLSTLPKALRISLRYALGADAATPATRRRVDAWRPALIAQAGIFAALTLSSSWWHYAVLWVAPLYPLVFVARKVRAFCEHAQARLPDDAADGERLVTYVTNPLERLLFAPMMMSYHGEHHLWPYVPYYNLPALHRLVGPTPLIEVRRSYLGFLWRYFRALPLARPSVRRSVDVPSA